MRAGARFNILSRVVYGPVKSRRLGLSLGLNILPAGIKTCIFDCRYCQCGFTVSASNYEFPSKDCVLAEIENKLSEMKKNNRAINTITFSGNGEPTMHPDFYDIVSGVVRLRNIYFENVKVAVLTNGAYLSLESVRAALELVDLPIIKLDTADQQMFEKLNAPLIDIKIEDIINRIRSLRHKIIQSMFVNGVVDNTEESALTKWVEAISFVKPAYVQIYSIDRIPADRGIKGVAPEKLKEICRILTEKTKIMAEVFA